MVFYKIIQFSAYRKYEYIAIFVYYHFCPPLQDILVNRKYKLNSIIKLTKKASRHHSVYLEAFTCYFYFLRLSWNVPLLSCPIYADGIYHSLNRRCIFRHRKTKSHSPPYYPDGCSTYTARKVLGHSKESSCLRRREPQ